MGRLPLVRALASQLCVGALAVLSASCTHQSFDLVVKETGATTVSGTVGDPLTSLDFRGLSSFDIAGDIYETYLDSFDPHDDYQTLKGSYTVDAQKSLTCHELVVIALSLAIDADDPALDLTFVQSADFFAVAAGHEPVAIAHTTDVQPNGGLVQLDVEPANLASYVSALGMSVTNTVVGVVPAATTPVAATVRLKCTSD